MDRTTRHLPQIIAQPTLVSRGEALEAAVLISPYGGAGEAEINGFASYASLTPLGQEPPDTGGPWHFWKDDCGPIVLALNKQGHPGAVHVLMELSGPPELWWGCARRTARVHVLWMPHLRHPTGPEMAHAIREQRGWTAVARRIEPVDLLP